MLYVATHTHNTRTVSCPRFVARRFTSVREVRPWPMTGVRFLDLFFCDAFCSSAVRASCSRRRTHLCRDQPCRCLYCLLSCFFCCCRCGRFRVDCRAFCAFSFLAQIHHCCCYLVMHWKVGCRPPAPPQEEPL